MVMKLNRDMKTEVVELQIAAQHWEEKCIELRAMNATLAEDLSSVSRDCSVTIAELRASLGEASRELLALKARLSKYE